MKKTILILMTLAALGASHIAAAAEGCVANLPEGNVGDGSIPNEEGDGPEGFQAFIGTDFESGAEATTANMLEANVGDGTKAN